MKKNKPLRAAGLLLVATMLTTCMTAGTFAKYTTSDSAADSARVAKFGVVVNANGSLFGDAYAKADNNEIVAYSTAGVGFNGTTNVTEGATVKSDTQAENVVAPGTKNDTGIGIKISGQPEVTVQTTVTMNSDNETVFLKAGSYGVMVEAGTVTEAQFNKAPTSFYTLASGTYTAATAGSYSATATYYELHDAVTTPDYYPVVFKLDGTKNTKFTTGSDATDSMAAMAAVLTGLNGKTFAPPSSKLEDDTDAGLGLADQKITWEWAFNGTDAVKSGADTILGDLATVADNGSFDGTVVKMVSAGNYTPTLTDGTDYNLDVRFGFTVAVDQVD